MKPFFGGTYFPPDDRYGRPGFPRVLVSLANAFHNNKADIDDNTSRLTESIKKLEAIPHEENLKPDLELLTRSMDELIANVDWKEGGFGGAPKFPNTMALSFLWRMGNAGNHLRAREAVVLSLRKMAEGGIYDHLGGGFSRYSVDELWAVPHFEKMLYDNACLLKLYSEVLLTDEFRTIDAYELQLFTSVIENTIRYVLREMTSIDGLFFAAQDADSLDEHGVSEEGAYFRWSEDELKKVLPDELERRAFSLRFGVTYEGNFENGYTVLAIKKKIGDVAAEIGKTEIETEALIASAGKKCFESRSQRALPGLDDKNLCSWNALMISGFAWAAKTLEKANPELSMKARLAAENAFELIIEKFSFVKDNELRLHATYKDGKAKHNGYLDDYAFLSMAALDLARFEKDQEKMAITLAYVQKLLHTITKHFNDDEGAGFFFTSDDHESLLARPKTVYDQAIPSGTAVALQALNVAREIFEGEFNDDELYKLMRTLDRSPHGMAELANAALQAVISPIVLSTGKKIYPHPFVFQKPCFDDKETVCHKRTCHDLKSESDVFDKIRL